MVRGASFECANLQPACTRVAPVTQQQESRRTGGVLSDFSSCELGSDCIDCSVRLFVPPPAMPTLAAPTMLEASSTPNAALVVFAVVGWLCAISSIGVLFFLFRHQIAGSFRRRQQCPEVARGVALNESADLHVVA